MSNKETEKQALRYNEGKPQHHWLDTWPDALKEVAKVFMSGADKYGPYNYKKGAPVSESYDSARRHLIDFFNGEDYDKESGHHSLAHAAWNILRLLDEQLNPSEGTVDDRPGKD